MNTMSFISHASDKTSSQNDSEFVPSQPIEDAFLDPDPLLTKMNTEEAFRQIPLTVFLGTLSVTGIFGNVLVCFIYGHVYKVSNSRTFIMCLAVVDLCACVFAIPVEVVTTLNQYQFSAPWTCRVARFTSIFTTITSATVLVLIAVDRYRKICKSLGWQISMKLSKILCGVCIFTGFFLSWPALALYGIKSTEMVLSQNINGTATECSIDDEFKKTPIPLVYEVVHTIVFLGGVCSLIVLYILIGKRVRFFAKKHEARRGSSSNGLDATEQTKQTRDTRRQKLEAIKSEASSSDDNRSNASTETKTTTLKGKISFSLKPDSSVMQTLSNTCSTDVSAVKKRQARSRKSLARNTTYLMFIISVVFIINYVPVLTLVLVREMKKDFVEGLNASERTTYRFFLRSYYLNAAVNPIIYSIFDRRFRKAVRSFFKEVCNKLAFRE